MGRTPMHNFLLNGGVTQSKQPLPAKTRAIFIHFLPDTVLADSEHVEVLRRGPRLWNDWRRHNPATVPNLIRLSLSAAERQMGIMNGGPVNLASARLRGPSLRLATLTNLAVADLSGADLTDAWLDGANLTDARFEPCLAQPHRFSRVPS